MNKIKFNKNISEHKLKLCFEMTLGHVSCVTLSFFFLNKKLDFYSDEYANF